MNKLLTASCLASTLFLASCGGDDGSNGANGANGTDGINGTNGASSVTVQDVLKTNANIAYAAYGDSLVTAQQLQTALTTFVNNPTDENFAAAKQAWLDSREPYGQTEIYRFRSGPIDALNDDGTMGEEGDGPEGRINAWPLGEGLIDYVNAGGVDGDAGVNTAIIQDDTNFPNITQQVLIDNFEADGNEANVTTGYHAIELLSWGQDLNEDGSSSGARDATPGQRPVTDFQTGGNCTNGETGTADSICTRRGQFLLAAAQILVDDLQRLVNAWNPSDGNNHYASFIAGGNTSLALVLESMGRLGFGELAGERMNIARLQDSQEDEHSCFSDNTHRDIFLNAKGIQNSFRGEYVKVDGSIIDGAGVDDFLLANSQADLENQLRAALEETMIKVSVIDQDAKAGTPFDNQIQISENSARVAAAIAALSAQTDVIENVIQALELTTGDLRQDTEEDI